MKTIWLILPSCCCISTPKQQLEVSNVPMGRRLFRGTLGKVIPQAFKRSSQIMTCAGYFAHPSDFLSLRRIFDQGIILLLPTGGI